LEELVDHADDSAALMRNNRKGQTILHRVVINCKSYPDATYNVLRKILDKICSMSDGNVLLNFLNKRCSLSDGLMGYTALFQTVVAKHFKCAALLLNSGAKPNIRSGFYLRTPLMEAASKGQADLVTLLLTHNAAVHSLDKSGHTALINAAQCGQLECLIKLIEANSNVNAQNYTGNSALMQAAWYGHADCIRALLKAKADVYCTDFLGRSVLRYAVKSRKRALLELILEATDVIPEYLSIGKAIVELDDTTMLDTLLKRGLTVAHSKSGDSVLYHAAEMGSIKCLQILLENDAQLGLNVNALNEGSGVTPLQRACAYGNHDIVHVLLQYGAEPDLPSRDGLTSIFYCMEVLQLVLTKTRGLECLKSLLRFGSDVSMKCAIQCRGSSLKINMTHLSYALTTCNLYAARMLVIAGSSTYEMTFSSRHQSAEMFPKELQSSSDEVNTFVKAHLQCPSSLFHLSRCAVRRCCHSNVETKIATLPLPGHIKDYLNLSEIEDIIDDYRKRLETEDELDDYEESISMSYESDDDMNLTFSITDGSSEEEEYFDNESLRSEETESSENEDENN
jgi:ankyrin repeat protein